MRDRFGAPRDFADAYVIAHEVGHHIQELFGISEAVSRRQQRAGRAEVNRLSVKLELQADFLAGVWAHYADKRLHIVQPGDVNEALRAAHAIGDDTLHMESQGYVVPDSFTHGTSAQRAYWFKLGYETGDLSRGDVFNTPGMQTRASPRTGTGWRPQNKGRRSHGGCDGRRNGGGVVGGVRRRV